MRTTNALLHLAVIATVLSSSVQAAYPSFLDADDGQFDHLAVDPVSGTVFVGARNRLHQLDADLWPARTVVTGPRLDNRLCTESFGAARCGAGGTTFYDALPTDNANKVSVGYILVF